MKLENLPKPKGGRKAKKRLGIGPGSGTGKTAGRGHKGQKARSGSSIRLAFEGGQTPLSRKLPKARGRGFTRASLKKKVAIINLSDLARFADTTIDLNMLHASGLVPSNADVVKLLGQGAVDRPYVVKVHAVSEGARRAIESAEGKIEIICFANKCSKL